MLQENAKHLHIMNVRIRPRVNARAKDENTLNGLKIISRMFQTILSIIMTLMIVIHLNLQIIFISFCTLFVQKNSRKLVGQNYLNFAQ